MSTAIHLDTSPEDALESRLFAGTESDVERARQAARHLVLAGGKRIRPRFALLMADVFGINEETATRIGAAAELVHTATLLHDDVIDQSDMRRGRQTVNAKYGAASAILTGDFLLAQALNELLEVELYPATRELSIAVRDLAEAEILQLQQAYRADTQLDLTRRIAYGKTAALFAWCGRAVAVTAGAETERIKTAGLIGRSLGYTFQIADDLLDFITGTSAGKPAKKDLHEGQITVPMQLLRAEDPAFEAALVAAVEERSEAAIAEAYKLLETSTRAEKLARDEIAKTLADIDLLLVRLGATTVQTERFQTFIQDCAKRLL